MRTNTVLVLAAAFALLAALAAAEEIADDALGLSGSVFDTPDPLVPAASAGEPGENSKLGSYFEGAPPMISHGIEDLLPITFEDNLCLDCHDLRDEIGADEATPMPVSHYTDLRKPGSAAAAKPVGARYTCTQCHAAQTDAKPLVASDYRR